MLILFNKSGKLGLIPVKKQVSKKGKSFMQTFWMKPEDALIVHKQLSKLEVASNKKPMSSKGSPWNKDDGFYVSYNGAAVWIPDMYVETAFHSHGHTFVIAPELEGQVGYSEKDSHLSLSDRYRAYEVSTGMSASPATDTAIEAMAELVAKLDSISESSLHAHVEQSPPIKSIPKMIHKNLSKETHVPMEYNDLKKAARELLAMAFGSDEDDWPVGEVATARWMEDIQGIRSAYDFMQFKNYQTKAPDTLRAAILLKITYDNSIIRSNQIFHIVTRMNQLHPFIQPQEHLWRLEVWAKDYGMNLTTDLDLENMQIGSGDTLVNGYDIVIFAVNNSLSLAHAKQALTALDITNKKDNNKKDNNSEEEFDDACYDEGGHLWTSRDVFVLSNWTGGFVKRNRETSRKIFDNREAGLEDTKGLPLVSLSEPVEFFNMVESHLIPVPQDTLWRGTRNPAWGFAKVGDIIPIGIASFSLVEEGATDFARDAMLVLDIDKTHPASGIDPTKISKLTHNFIVGAYPEEEEYLVMTPAIEVTSVEHIHNPGYGEYATLLHVRTAKTNFIRMMKSVFESRDKLIAEMGTTFDFRLHDEPDPEAIDDDDSIL